jgi:uncharacterized protein YfkK (UPF0435 family)
MSSILDNDTYSVVKEYTRDYSYDELTNLFRIFFKKFVLSFSIMSKKNKKEHLYLTYQNNVFDVSPLIHVIDQFDFCIVRINKLEFMYDMLTRCNEYHTLKEPTFKDFSKKFFGVEDLADITDDILDEDTLHHLCLYEWNNYKCYYDLIFWILNIFMRDLPLSANDITNIYGMIFSTKKFWFLFNSFYN